MSGLPPTRRVFTTRPDAKPITEIDPARRFDTYSRRVERLMAIPCAPAPVGMNPIRRRLDAEITVTPPRPWFAT